MPFTPSNSGQRSPPTYYRGCWHVVSRGFFLWYRPSLVPQKSSLHSEKRPPARGVAPSDLRPLRKIPHCCPPQESGPFSIPVWLFVLSDQLPIVALGGSYPPNQLIGHRPIPKQLTSVNLCAVRSTRQSLCGLVGDFSPVSLTVGQ